MSVLSDFSLKLRRGESPFLRTARDAIKALLRANLPLPRFLRPFFRALYEAHFIVLYGCRWALNYFYREPAFRSRCTSVGKNLHLWLMPDVSGHAEIHIGNNVNIFGHFGVASGRVFDRPRLVIHDGVDIGHNVAIIVNKEVVIEEDVNIASGVQIRDNDAHPRDPELRAQNLPPLPEDIKPVRICRRAWIGQGVYIMKGVTIGEGATIGVNSVVISDIPPYSVAIGNPARVIVKDVRTTLGNTNSD